MTRKREENAIFHLVVFDAYVAHLERLGEVGGVEFPGPDLRPVDVLLPVMVGSKNRGKRGKGG